MIAQMDLRNRNENALTKRFISVARVHSLISMPVAVAAVCTGAKSFRDNRIIGSPLLNRRGLHIFRRRLAEQMGHRRRASLAHMVTADEKTELEKNGYIVKRDFLDNTTFAALRAEIMSLEMPAREALIGDTLTRLIALDGPCLEKAPTARHVLHGRRYLGLLNYVGSFRRRPSLYVQTVFSQHAPEADPDIQSFYHTDTFHPTVKAWLYLEDVEDGAAPFAYVPGSHRMNRRRLAWERRVSVTAAKANDRLTAEGSFRISEGEIRRLGYPSPEKLPVAANTLIVADTSGIHCRSTPRQPSTRVAIWAFSRSNPFLPWTGGDIVSLPFARSHAQRIYWAVSDRLKDWRRVRRDWQWVGLRTPLSPP